MFKIFEKLTPFVFMASLLNGQSEHILFSEVVLQPSEGEYIKIYNPTPESIDLSNYYLTDATDNESDKFYYNITTGNNYWSGSAFDFIVKFPQINIGSEQSLIISLADSDTYENHYGTSPDISLDDDLLNVIDGETTIGAAPGKLDNSAETLILFYWDGEASTIKDVDYLLWGDNSKGITKTGILSYLDDTAINQQSYMSVHLTEEKLARISDEGSETESEGNGITGNDETSEPLESTWEVRSLASSKPNITSIVVDPISPTIEDSISFNVIVQDEQGISSVKLIYTYNSETTTQVMNSLGDDDFNFKISPLTPSGNLIYYILAENTIGLKDSTTLFSISVINPQEPQAELTIASLLADLENYVGQVIEIEGTVVVPGGKLRTNFTEAFLQDNSGRGIILYSSALDTTSFDRGDSIRVVAEVDEFDGKPELIYSDITIIESNKPIPVIEMSIQEFNSLSYTYSFVKIWGKIISRSDPFGTNTGANLSLQDESGQVTTIRIWNSTNILFDNNSNKIDSDEGRRLDTLLQVGNLIEVSGIAGSYSGSGQLQPAYSIDINEKLEGTQGNFKVSLDVSPYPFSPRMGEVIAYSYSFPSDGRIKLRLFDISGRLVTTIYDEYRGISFYKEATWNGRDNLGRLVAPGSYIMHLDIVSGATGERYEDAAPVVIGVYKN